MNKWLREINSKNLNIFLLDLLYVYIRDIKQIFDLTDT